MGMICIGISRDQWSSEIPMLSRPSVITCIFHRYDFLLLYHRCGPIPTYLPVEYTSHIPHHFVPLKKQYLWFITSSQICQVLFQNHDREISLERPHQMSWENVFLFYRQVAFPNKLCLERFQWWEEMFKNRKMIFSVKMVFPSGVGLYRQNPL